MKSRNDRAVLSHLQCYIPEKLISSDWFHLIIERLCGLPDLIYQSAFGFETDLSTELPWTDFACCIESPEKALLISQAMDGSPLQARLVHIVHLWQETEMGKGIKNLWLEFDIKEREDTVPRLFISFYNENLSTTNKKQAPILPLIEECFYFEKSDAIKQNLEQCTRLLPPESQITQIGMTHDAVPAAIRVCIRFKTLADIRMYLYRIGQTEDYSKLWESLRAVSPVGNFFVLHLDIGDQIHHKIGLECRLPYDDLVPAKQGLWLPVLEKLKKLKLCVPGKGDALTKWPGNSYEFDSNFFHRFFTHRLLYYLKFTYTPGRKIKTKGYFGFIQLPILHFKYDDTRVSKAVDKAVALLGKTQLPSGEWLTHKAYKRNLKNSQTESCVFTTALILNSLAEIRIKEITALIDKGIDFLLAEKQPGDLWSFWASGNRKPIYPDLDDTCLCSFILKKTGYGDSINNKDSVVNNRNERGLYYTWLKKKSGNNDIDLVVNTNVCLYLGETEESYSVIEYIINKINSQTETNTYWYYLSRYALYYMIANAYHHGVNSFGRIKDDIIHRVLPLQNINGAWLDPLHTALAVQTLLFLGCRSKEVIIPGINYLLKNQREDGAWSRIAFYTGPEYPAPHNVWFGSEELTTAFCIQVMNTFDNLYKV